jgi:DNA-binding PadR family transcriptional regulator
MPSSRTSKAGPEGSIRVGPGTLYEAIQRLQDEGVIEEAPAANPENGQEAQRRYYRLTDRGLARAARRGSPARQSGRSGAREPAAEKGARVIRAYRALLVLYPRAFRCAYGDDMAATVAQDLETVRRRGWSAIVAFWAFVIGDLLKSAGRLRSRQLAAAFRRRAGGDVPRLPHREERTHMETLVQDVRFGVRQFMRRPGFTAIAVISLALAIGGNSLIYGMVDGFVLRPFDYPDPDRLVTIGVTFPKLSSETTYVETLSPAEYADIRSNRSFLRTAAFDLGNRNLSGGDVPERVFTALLLDDPFPGARHAARAGTRLHRRRSSRRTEQRSRSSATVCGRRDSAALPTFSTGRSASAAHRDPSSG